MESYLQLLGEVRRSGRPRPDRTGTGVLSLFGRQLRLDLAAGFPLLTTKTVHFHSVMHELFWFLRGETNLRYLHQHGVRIWDEWADEQGELGPVYGAQWRAWPCPDGRCLDQLSQVLEQIHANPCSRRLLVSAWNVEALPRMALMPCHVLFQFYVDEGRLSCQVYQRSADIFLGLPFNLASYALLVHLTAQASGLQPGELVYILGDVHLYRDHIAQADQQLQRTPYALPQLRLNPRQRDLFSFCAADVELLNYRSHRALPATVSV